MSVPVQLANPLVLQFFNNQGQPNIGGSVLTQVGGVNYPTYQDSSGNTALPNPIPLNSRGEISNAAGASQQLFLATGVVYVFTMKDAAGNQLYQATISTLSQDSAYQAKGDILIGTGSGTKTRQAVGPDGTVLGPQSGQTDGLAYIDLPYGVSTGYSISAVASGNNLTLAIKDLLGNDPSSSSPIYMPFRSTMQAGVGYSYAKLTSALNIILPSGATLGTANNVAFKFWLVAFNNAGTIVLAVVNCLSGTAYLPIIPDLIQSANTISSGSNLAQTFYSASSVSNLPMRILGYIEYSGGLSIAGVYTTTPSSIVLYSPEIKLPGDIIQEIFIPLLTSSTNSTNWTYGDTIPTTSVGAQLFSQAITPRSAASLLEVESNVFAANSAASAVFSALFQDAGTNAICTGIDRSTNDYIKPIPLKYRAQSKQITPTTFALRSGGAGGTTTFNGSSGSRVMGGVLNSYLLIREIAC